MVILYIYIHHYNEVVISQLELSMAIAAGTDMFVASPL
jgi:hypothetical protein